METWKDLMPCSSPSRSPLSCPRRFARFATTTSFARSTSTIASTASLLASQSPAMSFTGGGAMRSAFVYSWTTIAITITITITIIIITIAIVII